MVTDAVRRRRRPLAELAAWPGRVVRFMPGESLSDGSARVASGGLFGVGNVPGWDTWVSYRDGALYAWIPKEMEGRAQDAIDANPEECLAWVADGGSASLDSGPSVGGSERGL
jgi:hypothetical protein